MLLGHHSKVDNSEMEKTMTAITLRKIDAEIQAFTTNRDKLRDQAHAIAMMIFYHAAPKEVGANCQGTGDCTRGIKLVKAMPKSWAAQMVQWFREYTPIRIVPANDKCEFDPKYKKLSPKDKLEWWKLELANETPFHEVTDEPDAVRIYDFSQLIKMVEQLSKRIEKKLENDEVKPEDVESAKLISATLSGLHFEKVKVEAPANANEAEPQPEPQADEELEQAA